MTLPEPRTPAQRRADTLAKLRAPAADVWVASASAENDGPPRPYLVPLSLAWMDERVVIAVESDSRTARNIIEHRTARLALGPTRDVVIIDAVLDQVINVADAPGAIADGYAEQAGWDPRTADGQMVYISLRPDRIQAWREVNELPHRTLMRGGAWVA